MAQDISQRDRTTDLGVVRINNDVLASIASIAATEVRGVYRMGGGITRTICDLFFKKTYTKGVRVHVKESEVSLTVSIIVEYGVDIPRVADEVQEKVKVVVEKMAGLVLSEVDVIVEGVHAKAPAKEAETKKF
ncbi:MAG: Asp23/Gls24 family envelope stress response protein [Candidatus Omnitrophota bacterium]